MSRKVTKQYVVQKPHLYTVYMRVGSNFLQFYCTSSYCDRSDLVTPDHVIVCDCQQIQISDQSTSVSLSWRYGYCFRCFQICEVFNSMKGRLMFQLRLENSETYFYMSRLRQWPSHLKHPQGVKSILQSTVYESKYILSNISCRHHNCYDCQDQPVICIGKRKATGQHQLAG